MKTYEVQVKEISYYTQYVEAPNVSEAKQMAIEEVCEGSGNSGDVEYKTKAIYNNKKR